MGDQNRSPATIKTGLFDNIGPSDRAPSRAGENYLRRRWLCPRRRRSIHARLFAWRQVWKPLNFQRSFRIAPCGLTGPWIIEAPNPRRADGGTGGVTQQTRRLRPQGAWGASGPVPLSVNASKGWQSFDQETPGTLLRGFVVFSKDRPNMQWCPSNRRTSLRRARHAGLSVMPCESGRRPASLECCRRMAETLRAIGAIVYVLSPPCQIH